MKLLLERVKNIGIIDFLGYINIHPVHNYRDYAIYHAPYRKDVHPSFKVSKAKNRWYDLATCKSGDIIDLGKLIYNSTDLVHVLNKIAAYDGIVVERASGCVTTSRCETSGTTRNIDPRRIESRAIVSYVLSRGVDIELARTFCVELHFTMGCKNYYALGFRNVNGGYEIRNTFMKSCVGCKDVSLIRQGEDNEQCIIFEGFMDFLSYLTYYKKINPKKVACTVDFLVLNSVSNLKRALPWVGVYKTIVCCLDNDDAGRRAVDFLVEAHGNVVNEAESYLGYKDFNDFIRKVPFCP